MNIRYVLFFLLWCLGLQNNLTQAQFANTLAYDSVAGSPKASLSDVQWLVGAWEGIPTEMGNSEETWLPPSAGSMLGTFKLHKDGVIKFYEICVIAEENNSLVLRLKHFDTQLRSWEAQNDAMVFRLVKVTPDRIYFDGFTFERVGAKALNIYVIFDHLNKEMTFNYKKRSK